MYPQGLYGNPLRQWQLFGRDGFLRNIPQPDSTNMEGFEKYAMAFNLRATLNRIARAIEPILPEDCPVIFGGGLIRDGIMGARPGDIDVWLPSNISVPPQPGMVFTLGDTGPTSFNQFDYYMHNTQITGQWITPVFLAPQGINLAVPEDNNPYRDMTNHWVGQVNVGEYPVQFMRTNVEWQNDPQDFMNNLMRNFDLFECMFFMCVQRGQSVDEDPTTQYVIIPQDMAAFVASDAGVWDQLGWNSRRNVTSQVRRDARVAKMQHKYIIGEAQEIDGNSIIAMPCPVSVLIDNIDKFPLPRREASDGGTTRPVLQAQTQGVIGNTVRLVDGEAPTRLPNPGVPPEATDLLD